MSTFSSRVHESSVQFVEPVHTAAPIADDVLVMHQVRVAGDRAQRHAELLEQRRLGARGRRQRLDRAVAVWLKAMRTATPRAAAARMAPATASPIGPGRRTS